MSSPDPILEKGYWLQDNLSTWLWNADRQALADFVYKLMPHISGQGLSDIYPLVSESYPPKSLPFGPEEVVEKDDPEYDPMLNYGGTK